MSRAFLCIQHPSRPWGIKRRVWQIKIREWTASSSLSLTLTPRQPLTLFSPSMECFLLLALKIPSPGFSATSHWAVWSPLLVPPSPTSGSSPGFLPRPPPFPRYCFLWSLSSPQAQQPPLCRPVTRPCFQSLLRAQSVHMLVSSVPPSLNPLCPNKADNSARKPSPTLTFLTAVHGFLMSWWPSWETSAQLPPSPSPPTSIPSIPDSLNLMGELPGLRDSREIAERAEETHSPCSLHFTKFILKIKK